MNAMAIVPPTDNPLGRRELQPNASGAAELVATLCGAKSTGAGKHKQRRLRPLDPVQLRLSLEAAP